MQGVRNMLTETLTAEKSVTQSPAICSLGMRLGSHTTQDPEIFSAFTLLLIDFLPSKGFT